MRLIDVDDLLNVLDRLDLDYGAMGGVAECMDIIEHAPTIEPIEDIKSCGVSADKSADQNVENVPTGDVNKVQTPAEPSDLISREEAIEAVCGKCSTETRMECALSGYFCCDRRELEALPSADVVSREDYHNLLMASNDIDRALREYQAKEEADADRPKGANLINRHDVTEVIREECWECNGTINDDLFMRIMSLPTSQQTDCTDFIMWLIEIVLDEEDWELNAVGYGEIIARQLKKLGLLEVKDGYYIRSSAEAEWIPFKKRPLTDEEKQEYPDWTYIFDCPLPDDEEEILLSNGKYVWTDTFINDGECYLDSGDDIDEDMAWMPLPKPYREDGGA